MAPDELKQLGFTAIHGLRQQRLSNDVAVVEYLTELGGVNVSHANKKG